MKLFDRFVLSVLPLIPRRVLWTVGRRYVAGDSLTKALSRITECQQQGFGAILDVLGENVESSAAAESAAAEYHLALESLADIDDDTPVSVKPTHLGLKIDEDLCAKLLEKLCVTASLAGRRVRLEMEEYETVGGTLDVFRRVRGSHDNLGCVLQARLFRTAEDAQDLAQEFRALDVRLVKGIYLEPPSVAWTEDRDISANYVRVARDLLDAGAFVALATHDENLEGQCTELLAERNLIFPAEEEGRYEFQCLMGVRPRFAGKLLKDGHRVRIYVPYGRDWHAYSIRRLKKNPILARQVIRATFGFGG